MHLAKPVVKAFYSNELTESSRESERKRKKEREQGKRERVREREKDGRKFAH